MTETPPVSTDRSAALRAYAATQHQTTVDRLQVAITKLENDNRPEEHMYREGGKWTQLHGLLSRS